MKTGLLIVDRFEGGFAVCEQEVWATGDTDSV
jgi:hypothetical protein